ncbi:hypothetical protein D3C72_2059210 [compost metagenome]
MQLVVISGMKMPSTRYRPCSQAFIARSTQVTSVAMMMMNTGLRMSLGIHCRAAATALPERVVTSVVASPSASALTAVLLIASTGHSPSSCTRPGFCFHRALWQMSRQRLALAGVVMVCPGAARRHGSGGRRPRCGQPRR